MPSGGSVFTGFQGPVDQFAASHPYRELVDPISAIEAYLVDFNGGGQQGAQGHQGAQGAVGSQGSQGTTGSGSQGSQGSAGAQGAAGPQGSVGSQGPAGAQGSAGSQGAVGAQGLQGPQGHQGFQGGGVTDITSTDDSVTVTAPAGPTTDLSVQGIVGVPWQKGSSSPNGAVVPAAVPAFYVDTSDDAFYLAVGGTNADWVLIAGNGDAAVPGVTSGFGAVVINDGSGDSVYISNDNVTLLDSSGDGLTVAGGLVSFNDGAGTVAFSGGSGAMTFFATTSVALTCPNVTIHGIGMGTVVFDLEGIATGTSASTGSAVSLPLLPAGYVQIKINGTVQKIPYYN